MHRCRSLIIRFDYIGNDSSIHVSMWGYQRASYTIKLSRYLYYYTQSHELINQSVCGLIVYKRAHGWPVAVDTYEKHIVTTGYTTETRSSTTHSASAMMVIKCAKPNNCTALIFSRSDSKTLLLQTVNLKEKKNHRGSCMLRYSQNNLTDYIPKLAMSCPCKIACLFIISGVTRSIDPSQQQLCRALHRHHAGCCGHFSSSLFTPTSTEQKCVCAYMLLDRHTEYIA